MYRIALAFSAQPESVNKLSSAGLSCSLHSASTKHPKALQCAASAALGRNGDNSDLMKVLDQPLAVHLDTRT